MRSTIRVRIPIDNNTIEKRTISTTVDATEETVTYHAEIELPKGQTLSEEIKCELISDLEEREKYYLQSLSQRR